MNGKFRIVFEPKQRTRPPQLAAGLASELKTDFIPYGRRFPVMLAAGSFNPLINY